MFISRLVIEGKDDGVEAINSNFDSYGSDVTFDGFSLVYEGDADDAYWSLPSQFLGNIVRTRTTGVLCYPPFPARGSKNRTSSKHECNLSIKFYHQILSPNSINFWPIIVEGT